jgi:hypothetical protein
MQYVQKLFSAHLMELLGTGDVEGCFDSHGDGVNPSEVDARFAPNVPWTWKSFWA